MYSCSQQFRSDFGLWFSWPVHILFCGCDFRLSASHFTSFFGCCSWTLSWIHSNNVSLMVKH
ncbi:hypothetical protein Hdeb2414_s0041g00739901 [Helianthus debilis subsp. tardiflorus]